MAFKLIPSKIIGLWLTSWDSDNIISGQGDKHASILNSILSGDAGCTGKRKRTEMVKLNEFDTQHLMSDVRLLEDVGRETDAAIRKEPPRPTRFLPFALKLLQREVNFILDNSRVVPPQIYFCFLFSLLWIACRTGKLQCQYCVWWPFANSCFSLFPEHNHIFLFEKAEPNDWKDEPCLWCRLHLWSKRSLLRLCCYCPTNDAPGCVNAILSSQKGCRSRIVLLCHGYVLSVSFQPSLLHSIPLTGIKSNYLLCLQVFWCLQK